MHSPVDLTDVVAIIVMVIASLRRLDLKLAQADQFPQLSTEAFEEWKGSALGAHTLAIRACFAKVLFNMAWYYGARTVVAPPVLASGGFLIFVLWVVALSVAAYRGARARRRQAELGIVLRGRPAGGKGSSGPNV